MSCSMQCRACGKTDAASKCSQCRETSYCSAACQKLDWGKHKMYCLPRGSKQSIAKALEIAILGRASPTVCESLEMLSRCFKESAGAKDPALARLQSVLQSVYVPPVVKVSDSCFAAFAPQMCMGVFETHAEAIASLKPYMMATLKDSAAIPKPTDTGLMGLRLAPVVMNYPEWALMALILARYTEEIRAGGMTLTPEDMQRPNKLPRSHLDPNLLVAVIDSESNVSLRKIGSDDANAPAEK